MGREQGESAVQEKRRGEAELGQEAERERERDRIQDRKGVPGGGRGAAEMRPG